MTEPKTAIPGLSTADIEVLAETVDTQAEAERVAAVAKSLLEDEVTPKQQAAVSACLESLHSSTAMLLAMANHYRFQFDLPAGADLLERFAAQLAAYEATVI